MEDEKGETRRQRNDDFEHGLLTPEFEIPDGGEFLWDWYHDASSGTKRIVEGVCYPIEATAFLAWAQMSGTIVRTREWAILRAMDTVFCDEMNKELQAFHEREHDRMRREFEDASRKK